MTRNFLETLPHGAQPQLEPSLEERSTNETWKYQNDWFRTIQAINQLKTERMDLSQHRSWVPQSAELRDFKRPEGLDTQVFPWSQFPWKYPCIMILVTKLLIQVSGLSRGFASSCSVLQLQAYLFFLMQQAYSLFFKKFIFFRPVYNSWLPKEWVCSLHHIISMMIRILWYFLLKEFISDNCLLWDLAFLMLRSSSAKNNLSMIHSCTTYSMQKPNIFMEKFDIFITYIFCSEILKVWVRDLVYMYETLPSFSISE